MTALFGGGANVDRIETKYTPHANQRSYCMWTYRSGGGGGSLGRIFDKRQGGTQVEAIYTDFVNNKYDYERDWSTTNGIWTVPMPSASAWHHFAVVYDQTATGNNPVIYIDGISQTVTRSSTPAGAVLTNTDAYVIGNRGTGGTANRAWQGSLAHFCIHDVLLSPGEIRDAMRYGFTPRGLRSYLPLNGLQPEIDFAYPDRLPGDAGLLFGSVKPGRTDCPVIQRLTSIVP